MSSYFCRLASVSLTYSCARRCFAATALAFKSSRRYGVAGVHPRSGDGGRAVGVPRPGVCRLAFEGRRGRPSRRPAPRKAYADARRSSVATALAAGVTWGDGRGVFVHLPGVCRLASVDRRAQRYWSDRRDRSLIASASSVVYRYAGARRCSVATARSCVTWGDGRGVGVHRPGAAVLLRDVGCNGGIVSCRRCRGLSHIGLSLSWTGHIVIVAVVSPRDVETQISESRDVAGSPNLKMGMLTANGTH